MVPITLTLFKGQPYIIYKEIYFKELAHPIMKTSKSKIYKVGRLAGDPGRVYAAIQVVCCRIFSYLGAVCLLFFQVFN